MTAAFLTGPPAFGRWNGDALSSRSVLMTGAIPGTLTRPANSNVEFLFAVRNVSDRDISLHDGFIHCSVTNSQGRVLIAEPEGVGAIPLPAHAVQLSPGHAISRSRALHDGFSSELVSEVPSAGRYSIRCKMQIVISKDSLQPNQNQFPVLAAPELTLLLLPATNPTKK